jgi:hypothetical protein
MSKLLNEIPAEDFDALVGQAIACRVDSTSVELQLEQVWRSPYPTGRELPGFSLYLRGSAEQPLTQGIIELPHPQHGTLQLFMTPIGRDAQGLRYEIVFN